MSFDPHATATRRTDEGKKKETLHKHMLATQRASCICTPTSTVGGGTFSNGNNDDGLASAKQMRSRCVGVGHALGMCFERMSKLWFSQCQPRWWQVTRDGTRRKHVSRWTHGRGRHGVGHGRQVARRWGLRGVEGRRYGTVRTCDGSNGHRQPWGVTKACTSGHGCGVSRGGIMLAEGHVAGGTRFEGVGTRQWPQRGSGQRGGCRCSCIGCAFIHKLLRIKTNTHGTARGTWQVGEGFGLHVLVSRHEQTYPHTQATATATTPLSTNITPQHQQRGETSVHGGGVHERSACWTAKETT